MRTTLFCLLLLAGCSCELKFEKSEANAERRHDEMMAEMEAARYDRLEAEKQALIKKRSDAEHKAFDLEFGR
jgi:hypothetical protein